ncbi:hypothetical protein NEIRO03_0573 [Nematocida sp. AWRm78]|nr:hypothetical protein NEIRO02_0562 [Nematocida sp. AWRm79]KAI5182938.1 hypothetical protein NEIRO03_0573 [Nematocida sp. AWRm78]
MNNRVISEDGIAHKENTIIKDNQNTEFVELNEIYTAPMNAKSSSVDQISTLVIKKPAIEIDIEVASENNDGVEKTQNIDINFIKLSVYANAVVSAILLLSTFHTGLLLMILVRGVKTNYTSPLLDRVPINIPFLPSKYILEIYGVANIVICGFVFFKHIILILSIATNAGAIQFNFLFGMLICLIVCIAYVLGFIVGNVAGLVAIRELILLFISFHTLHLIISMLTMKLHKFANAQKYLVLDFLGSCIDKVLTAVYYINSIIFISLNIVLVYNLFAWTNIKA